MVLVISEGQHSMRCNRDDGLGRGLSLEQGKTGHRVLLEPVALELQNGERFRQEFPTKYLCYGKVRGITERKWQSNEPSHAHD